MPEVSVVIPTYNRAGLLPQAINSVLSQDYGDFEIIVVDDGSTDDTQDMVNGLHNNRIRYIRLPENSGGSSKPRNVGLKATRGKYIAFLDSDDEWLPSFLSTLVRKLKDTHSAIGLVYCGVVAGSPNGRKFVMHRKKRGTVWPQSLGRIITPMGAMLIKRKCFDRVGLFDETSLYHDHWDMIIRLTRAYDVDYVPDVLAKYNYHANQRSREGQSQRLEAMRRKYAQELARYPAQAGVVGLTLGLLYAREGNQHEAAKNILANLKYACPVFIDYWCTHRASVWGRLALVSSTLLGILSRRRSRC